MKKALVVFLGAALLIMPAISQAAKIYGFEAITANSVVDPGIGEAQLSVEVADEGSGLVSFKFMNAGPAASSITDVYFDDGTLLGIASIVNGPSGVDFAQPATPPDLPSGNTIGFVTTAGFSADSAAPVEPNGVNPGEWVKIIFNLINGKTYSDTIAALDNHKDLRIGIHVQGFADGESEAFVNDGTPVPEPGTMMLLGSGLVGLAGWGRKKFRK
jgi:hypothetical protein